MNPRGHRFGVESNRVSAGSEIFPVSRRFRIEGHDRRIVDPDEGFAASKFAFVFAPNAIRLDKSVLVMYCNI
jgi:hypothetical protein